jgi:RNA-dependent RNA polymerase
MLVRKNSSLTSTSRSHVNLLGVPYETFLHFQDVAVEDANESLNSLERSARLLESHGLGNSFRLPSVMLGLEKLGVHQWDNPFYRQMMEYAVHHVLRELKHHARIPIPGAWTLVGVADMHKFLGEGEIFACVKHIESPEPIYLEGPVLISRSPTIHPGDVQIANAIGRPPSGSCFQHESLPNTVVFSVKGDLLCMSRHSIAYVRQANDRYHPALAAGIWMATSTT